ncbi:hypothetical protein M3Y99_01817800 [Aphelenchoides fujianensis]|nr:hypothetical protein M3Y99_01817800 [Aphelenchoides fujianensis]
MPRDQQPQPAMPTESLASCAMRTRLAGSRIRLLDSVLGSGSYSQVLLGFDESLRCNVAIKKIDRRQHNDYTRRFLPRELRLVTTLIHPNVVRVFDIVRTPEYVCMIEEYAANGDLLQRIIRERRIDEAEGRVLFRQFVEGLQAYVAVEISSSQGYTNNAVDVWSAGVVLVIHHADREHALRRLPSARHARPTARPPPKFPHGRPSDAARRLILSMVHPNPRERATLDGVIASSWLAGTP